jgi:hypothetical protein
VKALEATAIVSSSPYGSKMSDNFLLKEINLGFFLKKNKTGRVCVLC